MRAILGLALAVADFIKEKEVQVMVAVLDKPAVSQQVEQQIFVTLFNRGALTAAQVADAVGADESTVEAWLADKASRNVIDFDARFGRYATFE